VGAAEGESGGRPMDPGVEAPSPLRAKLNVNWDLSGMCGERTISVDTRPNKREFRRMS
jgi:hypothetical protein